MLNDAVELLIDDDAWLEIANIAHGVFTPLKGFMTTSDYHNVVDDMHLENGEPWTIPITLELPESRMKEILNTSNLHLVNKFGKMVAEMEVEDVFKVSSKDLMKIFGTNDENHPGVKKENSRSNYRVGGSINMVLEQPAIFPELSLNPEQIKKIFKEKNWETIVGFQTRNPLHRAHEYLQRVGMELADGIFIQPLLGWKKPDDFSPTAVIAAYQEMFEQYYPSSHAVLGTLMTPMRYAGPREAVFHAIVRRNYGCTHFIVGRDHAGVGNYYEKYEAQELCLSFDNLGIEVMPLSGPYYCKKCGGIVTEKTCLHAGDHVLEISGAEVRRILESNQRPPAEYMRTEISDILINLSKNQQLFCGINRK